MQTSTVVIIGGGCSGTLAAVQLLRQQTEVPVDIILVERDPAIGRGLAYQVPSDRCKLNVPAQGMSAFPDEPDHFLHWVQLRDPSIAADDFVSRRLYGLYLAELLQLHSPHGTHGSLRIINTEATDLFFEPRRNRWQIQLSNAELLSADHCILALGNLRRSTFCGVDVEATFLDPYQPDTYTAVRDMHCIVLVGSGLTAVDSVLEAEGRGFRGSYTMLSRHGRVPLAHERIDAPAVSSVYTAANFSTSSLRSLVRLFVAEARRQGSSQAGILAIRPHLQDIWCALSSADKRRFLRHVRPIWEVHRHRIPQAHHQLLQSLKAQGRLSIVAGHLLAIHRDEHGVQATIRTHQDTSTRTFSAALLCAGPEAALNDVHNTLLQRILARGILIPGPLRLGANIVADSPGSSRLSLLGPLQRESLWEITAVREIRQEAQKLATRIHQQIRVDTSSMT